MKKFLVLFLLLLPFVANAQWIDKFHEADELKGETAYTSYLFMDEDGNGIVYWSNEPNMLKVFCGSGIFDYDNKRVSAIIGLYDGDKLIEKHTVTMIVPSGKADNAYISEYTYPVGIANKIMKHLNSVGDVRFIISRYGRADMDLRVTKREPVKEEEAL